ncbi:hypothetical protein HAX54_034136, partial [Datura stramonium]|nr:hypothetical protein [Datura stramonium]
TTPRWYATDDSKGRSSSQMTGRQQEDGSKSRKMMKQLMKQSADHLFKRRSINQKMEKTRQNPKIKNKRTIFPKDGLSMHNWDPPNLNGIGF